MNVMRTVVWSPALLQQMIPSVPSPTVTSAYPGIRIFSHPSHPHLLYRTIHFLSFETLAWFG